MLVSVNKGDATAAAAGVNLYPNGQSFSGNYALRFNMYIEGVNGASTTEHVTFGINHSGSRTNWGTRSTTGVGITGPAGGDGLWMNVGEDAAAFPGGNDYGLFSYSTPTSLPTVLASRLSTAVAGAFKSSSYRFAGTPTSFSPTPLQTWVDVEVRHETNVVTLLINNTQILSYTNTTPFTSGNIMLGYNDAFGSIGAGTNNNDLHLGGFVLYDNLRVVSIGRPRITDTRIVGPNVELSFSDSTFGPFNVQASTLVTGTYANVAATLVTNSPGSYKATVPFTPGTRFFRIQR